MKVLLIGWDGATWAYIDPLLAEGKLPHLAGLLARGTRAALRSTRPPFTNVAWPSLVTGLSPAKTGVFDGARTEPGSYRTIPTNLTGFRGVPIWKWLNRFDRRTGVLNVPMTFPAQPLEGFLVTGFDSPSKSPLICYPDGLLDDWSAAGHPYRILDEEIALMHRQNPHHKRTDLGKFAHRWARLTLEQGAHAARLWESQIVDFLFVVFSGTDSVNHRTRERKRIEQVYVAADEALGRVLRSVGKDTLICLVSDHGSTPAWRYISLYRVLHEAGWLQFRPEVAERFWRRLPKTIASPLLSVWERMPSPLRRAVSWPLLQVDQRLLAGYENIDWPRTRVFARSGMGALYINRADRRPQGCVPPAEYAQFRERVVRHLTELSDERGRRLISKVWLGEEIYPDANPSDDPPDLVIEPAQWSDHFITGFPGDPLIRPIPETAEYGTHTPDGILALAGPKVRSGASLDPCQITDVVPTLLAATQLPVPAETDGRVITEAFVEPIEVERQPSGLEKEPRPAPSEADGQEVLDRLRALGYFE